MSAETKSPTFAEFFSVGPDHPFTEKKNIFLD